MTVDRNVFEWQIDSIVTYTILLFLQPVESKELCRMCYRFIRRITQSYANPYNNKIDS